MGWTWTTIMGWTWTTIMGWTWTTIMGWTWTTIMGWTWQGGIWWLGMQGGMIIPPCILPHHHSIIIIPHHISNHHPKPLGQLCGVLKLGLPNGCAKIPMCTMFGKGIIMMTSFGIPKNIIVLQSTLLKTLQNGGRKNGNHEGLNMEVHFKAIQIIFPRIFIQ